MKEFCEFVGESFFMKLLLIGMVYAFYMLAQTIGYWDGWGEGLKIGTIRVASSEWVCELTPGKYGETEWQCKESND